MNIPVLEDDNDIREMVCQSLVQNNHLTKGCRDTGDARKALEDFSVDAMVVDWMLPDSSGIEFIRWLRRQERYRQIPVLMLTAKAEENDTITGLEAGADDYLTKPMSLRELNARINALLRRPAQYDEQSDLVEVEGLTVNLRSHEVQIDGTNAELSKTEFRLLKLFIQNTGKVFSRDQILDAVWGVNKFVDDRTVDVHILRLRKILKPFGKDKLIATVRGVGYRLSASQTN